MSIVLKSRVRKDSAGLCAILHNVSLWILFGTISSKIFLINATHLLCFSHLRHSVPFHFKSLSVQFPGYLLIRSTGVHLLPLRTVSSMRISSNGFFQRERKVVVVLALLAVMCGPVRGSRSMKSSASARRANLNVVWPALDHWQLSPPPPPEYVQFPPPVHHHHMSPPCTCSPPILPSSPPSVRPPTSRPHLPPPLPSPSPPDEDRTLHSQNGRRLFSSEHVADPNSSRTEFLTRAGKCTDPSPAGTPLVPYGGYVPVDAPFSYGVPGPAPAPSPTSGADGPSNSQPAPPPQSGDNGTMAHTTVVSAMKFNQCTYTIITTTGNIEGAGTTADVNAEFFDKYGESVLFVNIRSQNRNFNRGATDTFTVVGDCVQNICKMHLSHDDSGPSPGWFVNTVTVSLMYQTHVFNVFEWLAKDEPPYSLSRTISSC